MNYPNGGSTPTTVVRDVGQQVVHGTHHLAHTGAGHFLLVLALIGFVALLIGWAALAVTAHSRAKWGDRP